VVGSVVVGLLVVLGLGFRADGDDGGSPLDGRPAPALIGRTVDDRTFDLAGFRGSWVVVNFFATWCVPCQQEHPELVDFSGRHAARGDRAVVSVVFNDPESVVEAFFARRGGDWPVVIDDDGSRAVAYAVTQVPESVLVDPTGVVVGKVKGGVTAADLDRLIDDLERPVAAR
jgi:cytochrome c biogenesis protein CcmG/thiol:disulfide interchange protein DsbE